MIAANVYGLNFVFFNFLKNDDFLWNSVKSSEFVNSVTIICNIKRLFNVQK